MAKFTDELGNQVRAIFSLWLVGGQVYRRFCRKVGGSRIVVIDFVAHDVSLEGLELAQI